MQHSLQNIVDGCEDQRRTKKETALQTVLTDVGLLCRCIPCKGSRYPATLPRPAVTVLPFCLSLCEQDSEKSQYEVSGNSESQREVSGHCESQCEVSGDSESQCEVSGDSENQRGVSESQYKVNGDSESQCEVSGDSESQCKVSGDSESQ